MSIATSASSDNSKVNFVLLINGLGKLKTLYNRRFSSSLGINRISCSDGLLALSHAINEWLTPVLK